MIPRKFFSWLTINRACNLRCAWCYAKMLNFNAREDMSIEKVKQILAFFRGLAMSEVVLIGGEPTLHPNFCEIIALVREAKLQPLVITNGIRFADEAFLNEAKRAGLLGITTSLKAGSSSAYEKFTGSRVFESVVQSIENVNKAKIPHKLSVTVHSGMFDCFDEVISFIRDSGTESVAFDMERPIIVNNETFSAGNSSLRELADFFVAMYPKIKESGVRFSLKISIPFCLFPRDFIGELRRENLIISGCQIFGGSGIIIDPQGRVLPCNHFCDNALGEVGVDFLDADGYYSFRRREDVAEFYSIMASCPAARCKDCIDWEFCGGGCRMHWLHKKPMDIFANIEKEGDKCPHKKF